MNDEKILSCVTIAPMFLKKKYKSKMKKLHAFFGWVVKDKDYGYNLVFQNANFSDFMRSSNKALLKNNRFRFISTSIKWILFQKSP